MIAPGGEPRVVDSREDRFRSFCIAVEPRLRRALSSAYGADLGSDATADALAWAWEHFERIEGMANPGGYLWLVGQSSVRSARRRNRRFNEPDRSAPTATDGPTFEPELEKAMSALSVRQRTAVLLVHGFDYSLSEAAESMGCRVRTLRNHLDRALTKLRHTLGVTTDV